MAVIQTNTPARAGGSHQDLVFQAAKEERQMVHQQYSVVVTTAQLSPERSQAQQIAGVPQQLLRVVKQVFVQHNHSVDHFPIIQQPGRSRRNQQVNLRLRI